MYKCIYLKLKTRCADKTINLLTIYFICIITLECQFNRDRPYDGVKDEDDDEGLEDDDGARGGRDSDGSGSSHRSSLGGETDYAQKVRRLQTAKQKLRQLQELVAMVQVRVWSHEADVRFWLFIMQSCRPLHRLLRTSHLSRSS